jgi:sugar lactone lactonase YvrE
VAGIGSTGYTGEGYPALASTTHTPKGVGWYNNTLYIADTGSNLIRRLTSDTPRYLVAVAGDSIGASSGFAGAGTEATGNALSSSLGQMATDADGNVYFADTNSSTIRKWIAATGTVATIAGQQAVPGSSGDGGVATSATLAGPGGVAVDPNASPPTAIYIADTGNHRIRVLTCSGCDAAQAADPTNWTMNAWAGNPGGSSGSTDHVTPSSASFNQPRAVAVDGSGNVYVADSFNCTVRRIAAGPGAVITIGGSAGSCGSGAGQLSLPFGVAVDFASPLNVYVAELGNHRVSKLGCAASCGTAGNWSASVHAGTGAQGSTDCSGTTPPTSGDCTFNTPTGVWVAPDTGVMYVADSANHKIRKVSSSAITTVVGTGAIGNSGDGSGALLATLTPWGVVTRPGGDMFITSANRVRRAVGPL